MTLNAGLCIPSRWLPALLLGLLAGVAPTLNAFAAETAWISALRRTTVLVADPEDSLRFYRDLLGFEVGYDQLVDDPEQLRLLGLDAVRVRAITLLAPGLPGVTGATIGLAQVFTADGVFTPPAERGIVLMFRVGNADALYRRVQAAGVPVVSSPAGYSESMGPTTAFTVLDPAGNRLSFAEVPGDRTNADLATLIDWMSGSFDNRAQFESQPATGNRQFSLLGIVRKPVGVPVLGDHVVYAQINNDADPGKVYRQRLLVFAIHGDDIRMEAWSFADPAAHQDILQRLDDLKAMPADAFTPALPAGCEANWVKEGDAFVGRIDPADCRIVSAQSSQPRGIQGTEIVGPDGMRSEESGYDQAGKMIFGLPEGSYYEYLPTAAD